MKDAHIQKGFKMSKLDENFRKRLERMREELNLYINTNQHREYPELAMPPIANQVAEPKKRGSIQEKYLSYCRPLMSAPDCLAQQQRRPDIDKVLQLKEESFSNTLLRLIDEKGLKDSEVYKKANIDRRLFSKIRGDEDYMPSKKTAIAFCLALQLNMEEAKKLLETAGYTLSASSRFDLIIMYLIENEEFNIHFANIVLEDYGEGTLSR